MKKQLNEVKRMQQLAGILKESINLTESPENATAEFEQAGFEFDEGILGPLNDGNSYYDYDAERIMGSAGDKFDEKAFNNWYDNFNMGSFAKSTHRENDKYIDVQQLVSSLGNGVYKLGEPGSEGIGVINNKNVTVFALPTLGNKEGGDFKVIFSINDGGNVEQVTSKKEVKKLLMQNVASPGSWMIY